MKKIFNLMMVFVLTVAGLLVNMPKMKVKANESIQITNEHTKDGRNGSSFFNVVGNGDWAAICAHGWITPPVNTNASIELNIADLEEVTDENTRKAAYYGWGGPAEWSGLEDIDVLSVVPSLSWGNAPRNTKGYHATHWTINNFWHEVNPKPGNRKGYESVVRPFVNYLNNQANAPEGFKVYVYKTGNNTQDLIIYKNEVQAQDERFYIKKTSANKDLTDIVKAGYSLQGAEYAVYASEVDAQRDQSRLGSFVTDANGESQWIYLPKNKTYYVKEVKAPKGFYLDTNVHEIYLDSEKILNVQDKPKFDPIFIALEKNNGNGKMLEGAHFEVKYYPGEYATEQELAGKQPLRTWVFKTNEKGMINYHDSFKISGDELFKDVTGQTVGLIGTYTFQEVKAPEGYLLDNTIFVSQIKEDGTVTDPNGDGTVYNAPIVSNEVIKGKIALSKQMDKNINGRTQDGLKVAGANIEFDIVDKNGNVVETIKTNEIGYAESNLLEYGQYTVKEKASDANKGYKLVKDFVVDIKENNKIYHYALENFIKQSKLKIVKTDAESKETVALAGFEFKLKDEQGNFVKQVVPYPTEKEIEVFTTDETGTVQLPENLVFGKYKIVEINTPANSGYVLSNAELDIEITGDETVLTVEFENQKQKLIVELEKFAEQLTKFEKEKQIINGKEYEVTVPKFEEKYLAGVTFELRQKDGTVLQRKTTTADSKLIFDPVDLGKYDLVEVETVTGYVLNSKPIEVVGTAQEQTIQFDIQSQKVKNDKQTYKVNFKKVLENSEHFKKEKAEAYKDVVFGLYTKQDLNINGVQIAKDTLVSVSGLNEKMEGNFDLMFAGEFYVKELATNQSYVLNETNTEVKVEASTDKQEVVTKIEKPIENKLKRVSIQLIKVDRLDHSKSLEGAEFKLIAITDAGEQEIGTYTTDKDGKIEVEQLETGKYRFIETKAPKGYFNSNEIIDLNIDSTVQNNDVIKVQVENDKIFKVHINKIDSLTKEALIDKEVEFTLYDKDMNVLEVKTVDLATGIATFDVKAQTQYYIKETKAPLGYMLSDEIVSVNLTGTEKNAEYTIFYENELLPVIKREVESGDASNILVYALAAMISLVGVFGLRKKED